MDEEEAGPLDGLPSPRRKTPWEIEEIAAAALLLAVAGLDRHAGDGRRGSPIDQGSTDPESRHR
jgi:hypothetical protein